MIVTGLFIVFVVWTAAILWRRLRSVRAGGHDHSRTRERAYGMGWLTLEPGQRGEIGFTYAAEGADDIPVPRGVLLVRRMIVPSWAARELMIEGMTIEPRGEASPVAGMPATIFSELACLPYASLLARLLPGDSLRIVFRNIGTERVVAMGAAMCRVVPVYCERA